MGQPIIEHQSVANMIADMAMGIEAGRMLYVFGTLSRRHLFETRER